MSECECDTMPPVYAPRRGVPQTEVASVSESHARELHAEIARLTALAEKTDATLTKAMDLAQYPPQCWSEDQDEDLRTLFSDCAEISAMRESLGLTGRAGARRALEGEEAHP